MGFGQAQGSGGGGGVGTTVEVSEIETLGDGVIIIGDNVGAPTTRAAFASSTGAFRNIDGTAAAPAYSFVSDTDTGVYSIGADSVGVATAGVLRLTVATAAVTSTVPVLAPLASVGAPSFSWAAATASGMYYDQAFDGVGLSYAGTCSLGIKSLSVFLPRDSVFSWASLSPIGVGGVDLGLARNAAGVVEVNNGTAGTYRDLKLRSLLPGGGATVTVSTPILAGTQTWNDGAVTFKGETLAITSTASAAASLLTEKTVGGVEMFAITKTGSVRSNSTSNSAPAYAFTQDPSTGLGWTSGVGELALVCSGNQWVRVNTSAMQLGTIQLAFGSDVTAKDACFQRNAAGVIEANSGTAGAYRDLITRRSIIGSPSSASHKATMQTILYGATTDAATAVEMTSDGAAGSGATNRIAVPSGSTLSVVLNISVKQTASASGKQMLRQVVISNNAGTTAIQGTVVTLGTDSGTAGLATVACTITANDTDDCLKVEVNGVAVTNLKYTVFAAISEVNYA